MKEAIFITKSGKPVLHYTMERTDQANISEYTFQAENKTYHAKARQTQRHIVLTDNNGSPIAEIITPMLRIYAIAGFLMFAVSAVAVTLGYGEHPLLVGIVLAILFVSLFISRRLGRQIKLKNLTFKICEKRGALAVGYDIINIDREEWTAEIDPKEGIITVLRAKSVVMKLKRHQVTEEPRTSRYPKYKTLYDLAFDPDIMDYNLSMILTVALSLKWFCATRES